MRISLIVVCHHSSAELPGCVRSFRREAAAAGFDAEVVLVEQSEDEAEAAAVASAGDHDRLLVRPNRGYAAGLNAGIAVAGGELLLLANPDIRFLDGSVGPLVDAAGGADVAGPTLLWDEAGEVLLPIPDDPAPAAELARTARRRWPSRRKLGRLLDASWRLWTAAEPAAVPSLRGPLLALKADTAAILGPLDEGYFLFYEETDWLWRARRRGARLVVAPRSRVVHRWGHATRRRADLAEIEGRSRDRFFERSYPRWARLLLRRLAPADDLAERDVAVVDGPEAVAAPGADVWLLSIVSSMEPAVGCLGVSSLPGAALELTGRGRWYAVAAAGEPGRWRRLGSWTWEKA